MDFQICCIRVRDPKAPCIHSFSADCPIQNFVKSNQHTPTEIPYLSLYLVAVVAGHKGTYQVARKKGKAQKRIESSRSWAVSYGEAGEVSLKRYLLSRDLKEGKEGHTGLREKASDKRKSRHSSVVYSRNSQRAWAWNVEEGVGKGRQRDEKKPSRIFLPMRWTSWVGFVQKNGLIWPNFSQGHSNFQGESRPQGAGKWKREN